VSVTIVKTESSGIPINPTACVAVAKNGNSATFNPHFGVTSRAVRQG
jgi:hypothetical protein